MYYPPFARTSSKLKQVAVRYFILATMFYPDIAGFVFSNMGGEIAKNPNWLRQWQKALLQTWWKSLATLRLTGSKLSSNMRPFQIFDPSYSRVSLLRCKVLLRQVKYSLVCCPGGPFSPTYTAQWWTRISTLLGASIWKSSFSAEYCLKDRYWHPSLRGVRNESHLSPLLGILLLLELMVER